ncbi:hypothetical protein AOCH_005263 [Aspergillus ochraceoroseus]|uniref:Uncharacterized protein n=2 Tax=Aspergillus ochraceoroseus TaxID=138278 RepID=A0A0F8VJR1_9EURO|nr:hypothetical protein AOCH_005263 [Aspergillus ochraceoroseus]
MDTTTDSIGPAPRPPQLCNRYLDETRVRFTPVKISNAPRVWDRKPSTSFLARSKSRKVWKRFRSSFNSMKALQQLIGTESGSLQENELFLEINTRRNTDFSRGVKRQCLGVQRDSDDGCKNETEHCDVEPAAMRGRSFLETKWESEVSRKQRKLPAGYYDTLVHDAEQLNDGDLQSEENVDLEIGGNECGLNTSTSGFESVAQEHGAERDESPALTPSSPAVEAAYPHALPGEPERLLSEGRGVTRNIKPLDGVDETEIQKAFSTISSSSGAAATDKNASPIVAMTDDRQLRQPSAATITIQHTDQDTAMDAPAQQQLTAELESTLVRSALRSSLDGEDTELLNNFLSKAKAKREAKAAAEAHAASATIAQDPEEKLQLQEVPVSVVEIPTPEARRVLEDLDTNSPSPQKSPSKSADEKDENAGDNASPAGRRSTRARSSRPLQRATAPTAVRHAFSLRRARGTEFVFLQRTEAQELALLTRRNTRQNKGDSTLPKFTLLGLARQTRETSPTSSSPSDSENQPKSQKPDKPPKKHVSWNDEQLVQFEGSESSEETPGQGGKATTNSPEKRKAASNRSSRSQTSSKTGGDKAAAAATTASATAPSRGRRVRRLGPSRVDSTTTTDWDSASSSPSSPTTSPIAKRKKLTPKSPKPTTMRTPSKAATSTGSSEEKPSLLSGGRSVKTSLLKVNAGSTPMPRRVRSRS